MNNYTEANKAFVYEMISSKKRLEDYPGKASDSITIHEPSSLPFGGTYRGMKAFQQFYPAVRKFYDFARFELQHVYGDDNIVFAIIKAGIANSDESILLCEQFTFNQDKVVEVRLFLHDYEGKPVHQLVMDTDR